MTDFSSKVKFISGKNPFWKEAATSTANAPPLFSSTRRQSIEFFSDYLNPFAKKTFVALKYHAPTDTLIGNYLEAPASSLLSTVLKIASYATILLPLLAYVGLLICLQDLKFLAEPKKLEEAAFKITGLGRKKTYTLLKKKKAADPDKPLLPTQSERVGGLIRLGSEVAWVSLNPTMKGIKAPNKPNYYTLTIRAFEALPSSQSKSSIPSSQAILATASLHLNRKESLLTVDQLQFYPLAYLYQKEQPSPPISMALSEAPLALEARLVAIASQVFYTAIRLMTRECNALARATLQQAAPEAKASLSIKPNNRITVMGELAEALTVDGPCRIVDDKYLSEVALNKSLSATIPLKAYDKVAFAQNLTSKEGLSLILSAIYRSDQSKAKKEPFGLIQPTLSRASSLPRSAVEEATFTHQLARVPSQASYPSFLPTLLPTSLRQPDFPLPSGRVSPLHEGLEAHHVTFAAETPMPGNFEATLYPRRHLPAFPAQAEEPFSASKTAAKLGIKPLPAARTWKRLPLTQ